MSLSRRSFALAGAATLLLPARALAAGADAAQTEVSISAVDLDGPNVTTVTVTVRNTAAKRLRDLHVTFSGPVGWTVEPAVREVQGTFAQGTEATATFELLVPAPTSGFQLLTFTATATYTGGDGLGSATGSRTERRGTALANLAAAYNNVGVTDESNTTPGNYDGGGNSFSAQKLADVGIVRGGAVSALGARLTWPDVASGMPGNVSCGSQAIALSGSGSRLVFLGSGVGFGALGSATVFYTDGTSSSGTFGFPNWSFQNVTDHGATQIAAANGRNLQTGYGNAGIAYSVFANSIPLTAGKTVELVVLPGNGGIHVFDMAIAP
ncbi:NEW3 domain-containing protein [Streptomyces sp. NPDC051940]|uniref:NEW3 domain-containing protein n=1 Tax=Streptomyces sp. NPDC051940 TaxID=3155675 RepID=UPI003434827A